MSVSRSSISLSLSLRLEAPNQRTISTDKRGVENNVFVSLMNDYTHI